ncbi:MlaD family protein [Neisseria sp. Ec49-e6-T10]|uniref:MlaD family protein n=1 Tax=Neisseria sp. Ec49-e6-T10 TaxID=3140744 RepID=UPI003EBDBAD8
METRAHYVIIGLFTVIVISAALLFSLWLNKSGANNQFKYYDVVFNEAVNGLSQGSAVQYSGIKIGEITQLKLDAQDPRKVWARVRISASTPIRKDTQAKLTLTSITGSAVIQLSDGSTSSPLLQSDDDHIPVIIATPSPLAKILANGEDLMVNINQLAANLNQLVSQENINHINKTLNNLEQITGSVASEKENIQTTLKELSVASKQLNETLTQTAEFTKNANHLLDTQGKQLLTDTTRTMASLEQTSATLNSLLKDNHSSINNGLSGLNELGPALGELRKTLTSLRSLTNRLGEAPSSLFSQEKPKEVTP